jgi:hypothetical protein
MRIQETEQEESSAAFISIVQFARRDETLIDPRSFDAIIEERSLKRLLLTTILEEREGRNRCLSQESRLDKSKEDPRNTLHTKVDGGPTDRSIEFERVYECLALRKRMTWFDLINRSSFRIAK